MLIALGDRHSAGDHGRRGGPTPWPTTASGSARRSMFAMPAFWLGPDAGADLRARARMVPGVWLRDRGQWDPQTLTLPGDHARPGAGGGRRADAALEPAGGDAERVHRGRALARAAASGASVGKHALRNSMMNTLTILSVNVGFLIGGIDRRRTGLPDPRAGIAAARGGREARLPARPGARPARRRGRRAGEPRRRHHPGIPRSAREAGADDEQHRRPRPVLVPPTPAAEPVVEHHRRGASPRSRGMPLQAKIGAGILGLLVLAGDPRAADRAVRPERARLQQHPQRAVGSNTCSAPTAPGRDVFSRTLYALRLDLVIVARGHLHPAPIGVLVGATGYFGGMDRRARRARHATC